MNEAKTTCVLVATRAAGISRLLEPTRSSPTPEIGGVDGCIGGPGDDIFAGCEDQQP